MDLFNLLLAVVLEFVLFPFVLKYKWWMSDIMVFYDDHCQVSIRNIFKLKIFKNFLGIQILYKVKSWAQAVNLVKLRITFYENYRKVYLKSHWRIKGGLWPRAPKFFIV